MLKHMSISSARCAVKVELINSNLKIIMEQKDKCCENCNCDFSKCNLDMTVRECLKAQGISPEAMEKFLKDCCKK